jgi:hypothetical protein
MAFSNHFIAALVARDLRDGEQREVLRSTAVRYRTVPQRNRQKHFSAGPAETQQPAAMGNFPAYFCPTALPIIARMKRGAGGSIIRSQPCQ